MTSDAILSLEEQLQLLKGQVEFLERALRLEKDQVKTRVGHRLTLEEYYRHLEATRGNVLDDTEPTELIRQMRTKAYN